MGVDWPPKVRPGFPLTVTKRGYQARVAGRWAWIAGKVAPEVAERLYHQRCASVGKAKPIAAPVQPGAVVTVNGLLSKYVVARTRDHGAGRLSAVAFDQIRRSSKRIDAIAGTWLIADISPAAVEQLHGALVEAHTADAARRAIGHFGQACRYGAEVGWCLPVRIGRIGRLSGRGKPTGPKWRMFGAGDIGAILAEIRRRQTPTHGNGRIGHAWHQLEAAVLLAINGGFGSKECAELTVGEVDLSRGIIDHARGKTGKQHLVPLWPETAKALGAVVALRSGANSLLFVNRAGKPMNRSELVSVAGRTKIRSDDTFADRFNEVLGAVGRKVAGESFYKLKHAFSTAADEAGDPHATFVLTGHALPGAKSHYVKVSEARLRAVVDHVRSVLMPVPAILPPSTDPQPPAPQSVPE